MLNFSLSQRIALADRLREIASEIAREDSLIGFLAAAVESGSVSALHDYIHWIQRMESARGQVGPSKADELGMLEGALVQRLGAAGGRYLQSFVAAARRAAQSSDGEAADAAESPTVESPTVESPTVESPAVERLTAGRALFLQAILHGQREVALRVAREAYEAGSSLRQVYREILQGALYEVGRMWQENTITVAQEHLATAVAQAVLAQLYPYLEISAPHRGRMVLAGVEGEDHQIGGNMVADVLEVEGWDVLFLGTNMPHEGILAAVAAHRADALGISATTLASIPGVIRLAAQLRQHCNGSSPHLLLGGQAFLSCPEIFSELGAVGVARDLQDAVALARQIPG